jgi:hypothetical protein
MRHCCLLLFLAAVGRYFIFQVFAVFIFNFLLGTVTSDLLSVVNKFREIADEPTKRVPELLGVGAAQTSSFYMSYILINVRLSCYVVDCIVLLCRVE